MRPSAHERIAGIDALVARPRRGDGPLIVFANAATPRGIDEPAVGRLVGGLAAAGFVAIAPELPHVRHGEVTPETVDALVSVASASGPSVAFFGTSTGAGLVLLAAADPRLAGRVLGVAAIAPFASLERMLRLATTGCYGGRPYDAAPFVTTAATRSLAAAAPGDPAVPALLQNTDPGRFDLLYDALAPQTRALVDDLSPLSRIGAIRAPVELASSPSDPFFPAEESRALAEAGRDVRLTVTHALHHVVPVPRPGLVRLVALLDRTLARAADAEPALVLRPLPDAA
jgi:alpha-beta hydrolase superfamily lysophospholipase